MSFVHTHVSGGGQRKCMIPMSSTDFWPSSSLWGFCATPRSNITGLHSGHTGHDPLFKLRPFIDPFFNNFQYHYILSREVSVDESMIAFKGQLSFIQYMPKKPTKWGMKAYVLADAHTGYLCNWYLYTGGYMYLYLYM